MFLAINSDCPPNPQPVSGFRSQMVEVSINRGLCVFLASRTGIGVVLKAPAGVHRHLFCIIESLHVEVDFLASFGMCHTVDPYVLASRDYGSVHLSCPGKCSPSRLTTQRTYPSPPRPPGSILLFPLVHFSGLHQKTKKEISIIVALRIELRTFSGMAAKNQSSICEREIITIRPRDLTLIFSTPAFENIFQREGEGRNTVLRHPCQFECHRSPDCVSNDHQEMYKEGNKQSPNTPPSKSHLRCFTSVFITTI